MTPLIHARKHKDSKKSMVIWIKHTSLKTCLGDDVIGVSSVLFWYDIPVHTSIYAWLYLNWYNWKSDRTHYTYLLCVNIISRLRLHHVRIKTWNENVYLISLLHQDSLMIANILTICMQFFFRRTINMYLQFIIPPQWPAMVSRNPSLCKTMVYLFYIVNIIVADALAPGHQ